MQNIAIPVPSPVVSTQTPTMADNNSSQTELFSNVLARQIADNTELAETNITDTALSLPSSTDDLLPVSVSDEKLVEPQIPTPDGISALPNDMLAALLPPMLAAQKSISPTQPMQPEAAPQNRARSITTGKPSLELDTATTGKPSLELDTAITGKPSLKLDTAITGKPSLKLDTATTGKPSLKLDTATTGKPSLKLDTATTAQEILNTINSSKSLAKLDDSQPTAQSSILVSAPQASATALAALQAQVSNPTNLNLPIKLAVNVPLTHNAWADDFSQKITWVATQHGQSAELHLNPPQLGPLDVLIKVNGDQATALFTSQHAVVRDAIEQALPKLREMLADNGIMLSNATVSDQSPREQQTKQTDQQHRKESRQAQIDEPIFVGSSQIRSGRFQQGSVDTFA